MKAAAPTGAAARLGRQVRTRWLQEMGKQLGAVDSLVVAQVGKVPTRDLNQLRQQLESKEGSFSVVKNALCRLAFREKGWADLEKMLQGTCGVSPIRGDAVAAAKLLVQFAKDHEGFVLKGGVMDGAVLTAQDLSALARLPTRQALLSQLAGVAVSPIRNLAMLLQGPIRRFALTLAALAQKKGKQEPPKPEAPQQESPKPEAPQGGAEETPKP